MNRATKRYVSRISFNKSDFTDKAFIHNSGVTISAATRTDVEKFNPEDMIRSMQSFGFFGSGNNANIYVPNETAASIMPKPEDFIDQEFRLISATIVGGESWKATDFSKDGVLRPSVKMLNTKPAYIDHDTELMNWIGMIVDPYWQEESTVNGVKIPAGINGTYRIDAKTNPKIARGVMFGSIFSSSVTINYEWEASHKFDTLDEFYNRIGEFDDKGKMITRVATKVLDYYESSLTWLGADGYAKKLDENGNPINIDHSAVYFSKAPEKETKLYKEEKKFAVECYSTENLISLSKGIWNPKTKVTLTEEKNKVQMKQFLAAFIQAFGKDLNLTFNTDADLTPEQETSLTTAISKLSIANPEDAQKLTTLNTLVSGLKAVDADGKEIAFDSAKATGQLVVLSKEEKDRLYLEAGKVTALEAEAKIGKEFNQLKRDECIRQYGIAVDGKKDDAVIAMFNESKPEALDGLLKQYTKNTVAKFVPTCTVCKSSENISMRSSFVDDKGEEAETGNENVTTSADLRSQFGKSSMSISK